MTFGQRCNQDKERIQHALKGELMVDEDVYEPAPKDECDRFILHAYDQAVYQAKGSME